MVPSNDSSDNNIFSEENLNYNFNNINNEIVFFKATSTEFENEIDIMTNYEYMKSNSNAREYVIKKLKDNSISFDPIKSAIYEGCHILMQVNICEIYQLFENELAYSKLIILKEKIFDIIYTSFRVYFKNKTNKPIIVNFSIKVLKKTPAEFIDIYKEFLVKSLIIIDKYISLSSKLPDECFKIRICFDSEDELDCNLIIDFCKQMLNMKGDIPLEYENLSKYNKIQKILNESLKELDDLIKILLK